jgi:hypothetical protein
MAGISLSISKYIDFLTDDVKFVPQLLMSVLMKATDRILQDDQRVRHYQHHKLYLQRRSAQEVLAMLSLEGGIVGQQ